MPAGQPTDSPLVEAHTVITALTTHIQTPRTHTLVHTRYQHESVTSPREELHRRSPSQGRSPQPITSCVCSVKGKHYGCSALPFTLLIFTGCNLEKWCQRIKCIVSASSRVCVCVSFFLSLSLCVLVFLHIFHSVITTWPSLCITADTWGYACMLESPSSPCRSAKYTQRNLRCGSPPKKKPPNSVWTFSY